MNKLKKARLNGLGLLLREARRKKGWTQKDAAGAIISSASEPVKFSQAGLAQLETGTVQNPSQAILASAAQTYGLPYEKILAELLKDKYNLLPPLADFMSGGTYSVEEIFSWKCSDEPLPEKAWFVVPSLANMNWDMVRHLQRLASGGTEMLFCIEERDVSNFKMMVQQPLFRLTDRASVAYRVLTEDELSWLSLEFVIFNPALLKDNVTPQGFYLFKDDANILSFGAKMSYREVVHKFLSLSEKLN